MMRNQAEFFSMTQYFLGTFKLEELHEGHLLKDHAAKKMLRILRGKLANLVVIVLKVIAV